MRRLSIFLLLTGWVLSGFAQISYPKVPKSTNDATVIGKLMLSKLLVMICLGLFISANGCTEPKSPQEWSGITVDVKADNTIESSQKLTKE